MAKSKILIPMFSHSIPKRLRSLSAVNNTYLEKINEFGLIPILVSGYMENKTIDELYNLCSGVLLPGGGDINPELYGQKPHAKTKHIDEVRDALELELVKKTLEDKKPFLGICRGAQMLAIACGGTLNQHLPEITKEKHGFSEEESMDTIENNPEHEVQIILHTKMHKILKADRVAVISRHHQAIDNPGCLTVSGSSPDGIIEMVEHPDLPFHIGIQSHPELHHSMDGVFKAFAEVVKKY